MLFSHAGLGKAANHPVQTVDWFDCVKWSNARSQQAGLTPVYYTDAGLTQVYATGDVDAFVCELGGQRVSVADGGGMGEGGAGRVERASGFRGATRFPKARRIIKVIQILQQAVTPTIWGHILVTTQILIRWEHGGRW